MYSTQKTIKRLVNFKPNFEFSLENFIDRKNTKPVKIYKLGMEIMTAYIVFTYMLFAMVLIVLCMHDSCSLIFLGRFIPFKYYRFFP